LTSAGSDNWHQDSPDIQDTAEASDQFGYAIAAGDFDDDGFDDLAIGVPYEDDVNTNEGVIQIIQGSIDGLTDVGDQRWRLADANDNCGYSLAAGDFDSDGFTDLAVGIPHDDVGGLADSGSVTVIFGTATGLLLNGTQQSWNQDSTNIEGVVEAGDQFGYRLAAEDFDGDGFEDLAISAPFDDVGAISNAGAVNVIYGSTSGLDDPGDDIWTQDSANIDDSAEASDNFGYRLACGDFDGDSFLDLAIGVPYEDVGAISNAGAVNVIFGASSGLTSTGDQLIHQDWSTIQDTAEASDYFGYGL
jgi:hypothetical protein